MGNRVGQKGQALLEYILLILISMILILGVVWKFNMALHSYMAQVFNPDDGYLACLIKNAVLPGDDICQSNIPKFDFNGAPEKKLAGGNLSTDHPTVSNTQANAVQSSQVPSSSVGGSSSSGGGSRSKENSATGIATNGADFGRAKAAGGGSAAGASSASDGKDKKSSAKGGFESADVGGGGDSSSSESGSYYNGRRTVPAGKDFKGGTLAKDTVPTNERDLKTAREIAAEKLEKKAAGDEDGAFTFGNFMKWIIIILLLILIIFFVGSQFMAVSRGNKRS